MRQLLVDGVLVKPLSERQHQIMRGMASGLSTLGVARQLGVSRGNVRKQVSFILTKLCAASRPEAIKRYQRMVAQP